MSMTIGVDKHLKINIKKKQIADIFLCTLYYLSKINNLFTKENERTHNYFKRCLPLTVKHLNVSGTFLYRRVYLLLAYYLLIYLHIYLHLYIT